MPEVQELERARLEIQEEMYNFEMLEEDYEEEYQDFLDDDYPVCIGNLRFEPSRVLKTLDPIAYETGLSEYVDSLDVEDDPRYQELKEELEEIEEQIEDCRP